MARSGATGFRDVAQQIALTEPLPLQKKKTKKKKTPFHRALALRGQTLLHLFDVATSWFVTENMNLKSGTGALASRPREAMEELRTLMFIAFIAEACAPMPSKPRNKPPKTP